MNDKNQRSQTGSERVSVFVSEERGPFHRNTPGTRLEFL